VQKNIIRWNEEKNQLLKLQRDISFEDILERLENGELIAKMVHPNHKKYPNQEIFIVNIKEYIYYVPFVENDEEVFLKTIIPSRKLNRIYGEKNEK